MRAFIAYNFMGIFAFDGAGELIEYQLFPKKPELIAQKLLVLDSGRDVEEDEALWEKLRKLKVSELVCNKRKVPGFACIEKKEHIGTEALKSEFRRIAMDLHWASSQAEINDMISKVNLAQTKAKLKEVKKDRILMNATGVLDEIDRTINVFSERLREWYGLHFPEALAAVESHERFAKTIADFGFRERIEDKSLSKLGEGSAGMEFSEEDMNQVRGFASVILELFERKKKLTRYIELEARQLVPNLQAVAGPLLAMRLVALAGGLEKLSKMPSSTIQLLGAEKALFRHLKGEGRSPKFGIIFSHRLIQNAPRDAKGRVARLLAAKLSMAARIDNFSKEDHGDQLAEELEKQARKAVSGRASNGAAD